MLPISELSSNILFYDGQISRLRTLFDSIGDHRARNTVYSLSDILMSGFAMFLLKHGSIHRFEHQTRYEKLNLEGVFGISKLCTDAQMRNILDEVSPESLRPFFDDLYGQLSQSGITQQYQYYADCLILALDGVEHFHSTAIHCSHCQQKATRDGQTHYTHSMLCAALLCPEKAEVFTLDLEPITKQDGGVKNDCERNACGRLMARLKQRFEQQRFILTGDALYANAPHIRRILANSWHFVLNIKPDSHKTLFNAFEARRKAKDLGFKEIRQGGNISRFYWANNLPLCETAADIRLNVLWCEITDKKGKTTRFTWCTDFDLTKKNVDIIANIGRCRWKIENETFNTLKNQGYEFEHNYGHGFKHLATTLAVLMFIAFAVDQLIQATSQTFKNVWKAAKTKSRIWESVKAIFMTQLVDSFISIYKLVELLFIPKLE